MTNPLLQRHYEDKYSHEVGSRNIERVTLARFPASRSEAVVKYFPTYFRGGDILELGAGNGSVAKTLLETTKNIKSYMLGDLSLARMEGIGNNLQDDRVSVSIVDAENIPECDSAKYDAIIMVALIEHLIDPMRALAQIRKMLKPGGFVYIDTPNIAKYSRRVKLAFGRFPSTASKNEGLTTYSGDPTDLNDEGHFHYFTYRSLSKMLSTRCGYSKIIKLGYADGRRPFGVHANYCLAKIRPELFSDVVVLAYN